MIRVDISVPIKYTASDIKDRITELLPVSREEIGEISILTETLKIDTEAYYKLSVGVSFSEQREAGLLKMKKKVSLFPDLSLDIPTSRLSSRPVVVGAGPAGLFAALALAESGARPIVIERGDPVEKRVGAISRFTEEGVLDAESNIQFGEGGAGAFSDGKLKYGAPDKYTRYILSAFVSEGAPEHILYSRSAHLGTDRLPAYVAGIRERIKSLGGEFIYRAKLTDIIMNGDKSIEAVFTKGSECERISTEAVILAIGHSARDTLEMLYSKGFPMEAKGFGIGMRIEHPREYINGLIFKHKVTERDAGAASYHLVTHLSSGRSVYSFCMCPGGEVVAAASSQKTVLTNGMSKEKRNADNSNSALLVSLTPKDFGSGDPLAGIRLQSSLERAVYLAGGEDYRAPAIRLSELYSGKLTDSFGSVIPSYPIGTRTVRPEEYLPSFITDSLKEGIIDFDNWLSGFNYPDAVLTGAETRSTSPVRILRSENYSLVGCSGIYPVGEGAGYAGGIISSARDGLLAALSIIEKSNI